MRDPTHALVRFCTAPTATRKNLGNASVPVDALAWKSIHAITQANRVSVLFFNGLKDANLLGQIAESDQAVLLSDRNRREMKALQMKAALIELSLVFRAHGIAMLALKGPVIAEKYYADPATRQYADLDILVRPADRERAWDLLTSIGYASPFKNNDINSRYHVVFYKSENARHAGTIVELHWRIAGDAYPAFRDGDFLWNNPATAMIGNHEIACPNSENHFLYLCLHAYKHDWERLQWIRDLPEVTGASENFGWGAVLETAQSIRALRPMLAAIQIAEHVYPGCIEHLPKAISENAPILRKSQMDRVVARLFATTKLKVGARDLFALRVPLFDRHYDQFRFILRFFKPTDRDIEFVQISKWLWPAYFLIRPARMLRDFRAGVFPRPAQSIKPLLPKSEKHTLP